jgi:hypothetical protein
MKFIAVFIAIRYCPEPRESNHAFKYCVTDILFNSAFPFVFGSSKQSFELQCHIHSPPSLCTLLAFGEVYKLQWLTGLNMEIIVFCPEDEGSRII